MDFFAHGFWSYIFFFASPQRWLAVLFGVMPDLLSFFPHIFIDHRFGGTGTYHLLYQYTHSLVFFVVIFIGIMLVMRSMPWFAGAWGLHIIFDMFTHPAQYYATPYLFPFSSPIVPAIDYRTLAFTVVNYIIIIGIVIFLYFYQKKMQET